MAFCAEEGNKICECLQHLAMCIAVCGITPDVCQLLQCLYSVSHMMPYILAIGLRNYIVKKAIYPCVDYYCK